MRQNTVRLCPPDPQETVSRKPGAVQFSVDKMIEENYPSPEYLTCLHRLVESQVRKTLMQSQFAISMNTSATAR